MAYKNNEKERQYHKKWYQENKEKQRRYFRKWKENNPEKYLKCKRKWKEKNKEEIKISGKKYRQKPEVKKRNNERRKRRRKIDPRFHLDDNMGNFIRISLKRRKAGYRWENLVGYTIKDLMKHLENQFDENMFWNNYGSYWWIDHIKPISLFNYTYPEDKEFKECWALSNLQPLEKVANIKKSNKY